MTLQVQCWATQTLVRSSDRRDMTIQVQCWATQTLVGSSDRRDMTCTMLGNTNVG